MPNLNEIRSAQTDRGIGMSSTTFVDNMVKM
jgi:hypothetical protein